MEDIYLVFDSIKRELSIKVGDETLVIESFQGDTNDEKFLKVLKPYEQVKLIKKLVNNLKG